MQYHSVQHLSFSTFLGGSICSDGGGSIYSDEVGSISAFFPQISPDSTFSERLKELMKTCPLAQTKEMGFPQNWLDEQLWE